MEIVRTLGVAIDATGAKAGAAAASGAFANVGKAAKETEGSTKSASKALKETGDDMKKTASAGEMLRAVLDRQTTILGKIDVSIRKLTTALKEQASGAAALKTAQAGVTASTEAAAVATEKHRSRSASATSALAAYATMCGTASGATTALAVSSAGAASGMAASAASATVTASAYLRIAAAANQASQAQSRVGESSRRMVNVTGTATPALEAGGNWRSAHAQFRAHQAKNMGTGATEYGGSSWIVPAASTQLAMIRSVPAAASQATSAMQRFNAAMWGSYNAMSGVGRGVSTFVGHLTSMKGMLAATGVAVLTRDLLGTEVAMQRAANAMRFASGSSGEFAKNQQFVRRVVDELGMDLLSSSASFAKLAASAKGTSLEGSGIRDLFLATAKGATAMGLSVQETDGALNAFSQMLSKGTVAAEELRGQLGERLYGAFNMAAKAMGMTTQELNKLLADGKIAATDLLPALTREMDKAFSADASKNAHSLQAEMNRLKTAWTDPKATFMENGGGNVFTGAINGVTELLNKLRELNRESTDFINRFAMAGQRMFGKEPRTLAQINQDDAAGMERLLAGAANKRGALGPQSGSAGAFASGLQLESSSMDAIESARLDAQRARMDADGISLLASSRIRNADAISSATRRFSNVGVWSGMKGANDFQFDKKSVDAELAANAAHKLNLELKKQGEILTESLMTPMEEYSATLTRLDALLSGKAITTETYGRAVSEAGQRLKEMKEKAEDTSGPVNKLFRELRNQGIEIRESVTPSVQQYAAALEKLQALEARGLISKSTVEQAKLRMPTGSLWGDFKNGAKAAGNELTDMFKQAQAAGQSATSAMADGFSDFFGDIIDGADLSMKKFSQMTSSILRDIAKIISQRMIAQPIAGAIMSGLGTLFGAPLGAAAAGGAGAGAAAASGGFGGQTASMPFMHTGGFVGLTMGPRMLVDPSIFNNAPRFHNGLKPDEFPAILQRGEEVVPKNEVGQRGVVISMPITVNVDGGKGGTHEENQKFGAEIARQMEAMVDERIARALMPGGVIRRAA